MLQIGATGIKMDGWMDGWMDGQVGRWVRGRLGGFD
jgi:hypothetical protein